MTSAARRNLRAEDEWYVEWAQQRASDLSSVARTCKINLEWMHFHSASSISLLDADIISGAIRSLGVSKLTAAVRVARSGLNLEDFVGPHVLSLCLRRMPQFCLPPGTVGELLRERQTVGVRLSDRASQFVQLL